MTKPTSPSLKTVLLVDDQDAQRATTKWFLTSFGFTVETVGSAEDALDRFDPILHDAVVTENIMPGMNGTELAHVVKLRSGKTPVVMFARVPPAKLSCLDAVILRPAHLLTLKEELDRVLISRIEQ